MPTFASRTFVLLLLLALTSCHVQADRDLLMQRVAAMQSPRTSLRGAEGSTEPATSPPSREEVTQTADLDRYLRYGLHHNADLRASYELFLAAIERIPQVSSLPDPVFTFSQFIEEVQTRTGPQQRRYSLTQAFPWFGELELRGSVAKGQSEELWQRVVQKRLAVEQQITVRYAEYGYLAHSIRIIRNISELLRELESTVQQRIAAGAGSRVDLLRLQVEIGRVENELASRERIRPSLSAQLAAAMNLQQPEMLPMPLLTEPSLLTPDVKALVQRAIENNPELRELAERARKNRDRLRLAKLDRWPDFQVGVDYLETDGALLPTPGSGDDPWSVRIGFTLPVWRAKYDASEREAERNIRAAVLQHEDRRARLRADIEAAAFRLDDAARQVVLYRDTLLPRARESLTVTRTAYTTGGATTLLDTIDSEQTLLQFETAYWRACRDHYQSQARLTALTGGEQR